jgi:hypothetical protein
MRISFVTTAGSESPPYLGFQSRDQYLYLYLITRTRYPMAETWDPRMHLSATRHLRPPPATRE